MGYKKHAPQIITGATIHEPELIDTRYIAHLLNAGGNRVNDMIAVIFAKPKHIIMRKNISLAILTVYSKY